MNRNEDRFAEVVMSYDDIVGYVPRTISHLVLQRRLCEVTGNPQCSRDLRQLVLQVPKK